jgi:hypothetical protein
VVQQQQQVLILYLAALHQLAAVMAQRMVALHLRESVVLEVVVAMEQGTVQGPQVHLGKVARVGMVIIITILIRVAAAAAALQQLVQTLRVIMAAREAQVAQPQ